MITLAQITDYARKILKIAGILAGAIILFVLFFNLFNYARSTYFPPPPPPPDEGFGKLPVINFPKQEKSNISYRINTITGSLPSFSDRALVFKIKKLSPYLFNLQDTKMKLSKENFNQKETKISDIVYQWFNSDYQDKYIIYDIVSKNFRISSSFYSNKNVLDGKNLPQENGALSRVIVFLNNIQNDTTDIDQGKARFLFYQIKDGKLIEVPSLSQAQIIKVILFQKDINNLSIYYSSFIDSPMVFLVAGGNYNPEIWEANFSHYTIDEKSFSSYPIKTSTQAFDDLKNGNAYIYNPDNKKIVEITDISLGYYLGEENHDYLFPVVIFKGKNFIAYVQTLADSSILH